MKPRFNKNTIRGKGVICPNCNRTDWRIHYKFSGSKFTVFYCIHCGAFRGKLHDLDLKKWIKESLKNAN